MKLEAKARLLISREPLLIFSKNVDEAGLALKWLSKAFTISRKDQFPEDNRALGEGTVEFKAWSVGKIRVQPALTLSGGKLILDFPVMNGSRRMNDKDEIVAKTSEELKKKVLNNLKSFIRLQVKSGSATGAEEAEFCKKLMALLS